MYISEKIPEKKFRLFQVPHPLFFRMGVSKKNSGKIFGNFKKHLLYIIYKKNGVTFFLIDYPI